ncbi:hypothetical protein EV361DRAFT_958213 [Lentinula raphanica]|nr:hypothetical protein EV361DRAFT_958213 [Lentinula raphanica]
MKKNWTKAPDRWEREGHAVDKTNFLSVYAEAHTETLTEANIKAAFRKTGVIPFDPSVVTAEMMAPSQTTSVQAVAPIRQITPVRIMTDMVQDYIDYVAVMEEAERDQDETISDDDTDVDNEPVPSSTPLFVRHSLDNLRSTSAGFLVDNTPIKSTSKPPSFSAHRISPKKINSHYSALLETPAETDQELKLRDALIESEARDAARKEAMMGMQAGVILSNIYAVQVNKQLQAKEDKEKSKGKKKLMGNGKAKLFTGDEFYKLCEEHEQHQQKTAEDAVERREAREKKERYDEAVALWEAEKAKAKAEKRRAGWCKPKWREDFKPESLKPRPKRVAEEDDEDDDDGEGKSGDEHED